MIQKILKDARRLGACAESDKATSWKSLAYLFFSPQGREFCEEHHFPHMRTWHEIRNEARQHDIYVDAGVFTAHNPKNIGLIGNTRATLTFTGADYTHKVILQHNARARIVLSDYAVVLVVKASDDVSVDIVNDGTGLVLT